MSQNLLFKGKLIACNKELGQGMKVDFSIYIYSPLYMLLD